MMIHQMLNYVIDEIESDMIGEMVNDNMLNVYIEPTLPIS